MKMKNMVLVIMACFLIFISMSCICACDDADVANTRDASEIIVDDAIDDSIDFIDDGASSAADDNMDDSGSSADDSIDFIDDGASSDSDSIDIVDGDSIIKNMTNDIPNTPKYNSEPISNLKDGGDSFADVQNLINNLPVGSVLYLYKDYTMQKKESPLVIAKDITINGNNHKLDADGIGSIFTIIDGNVVLSNLVLTNGKASSKGGAIELLVAKSLECDYVTFSFNIADSVGGAVFIEPSISSTFIGCHFNRNYAYKYEGGAIFTKGGLTCRNCEFLYNTADNYGGAIFAVGGLTCTNCEFRYNTVDNYGGAIRSESSLNCINCFFQQNRVLMSSSGGAISSGSLVNCRNCEFYNNSAYKGSAIYSEKDICVEKSIFKINMGIGAIYSEGNIVADSSSFNANYAKSGGAAIRSESTVNCTDCMFINNYADFNGIILAKTVIAINSIFQDNNALYAAAIYTSAECTVKSCEFIKNSANYDFSFSEKRNHGGAIYSCGLLTAYSSKFSYNAADDRGGAIYAESGLKLLGDNEFIANDAHDFGGAIYSKGDAYVNWDDNGKSNFKSNRANSDNGGAVYSEKSVYVRNGVFDSNFAEDNGGAIFSKGNTYVNWNGDGDTIFKYNRANTDEGGSIYSEANVYVKNSDFSYGYAHDGGAIYACGNTIIDSSVFNVNYASHQGGAIYDKNGVSLRGRTSFAANEAKDSGGAIYTRKFDEDVYHATFRYNVAGDDGGAIYIDHENHETFTECDFEDNYAGDEGGAIYLDDGDSNLSLKRNNLVNNKAKSGYTVYNHGNYGEITGNWHGSTSPNFDNQFKKYRLILKDKVITPSSYAKTRISW